MGRNLAATVFALSVNLPFHAHAMVDQLAWDGQKLSMAIGSRVTLRDVLLEVGRAAGFSVVIDGELGTIENVRLRAVPLVESLRKLAGNHGLVMVYARDTSTFQTAIRSVHVIAARHLNVRHPSGASNLDQAAPRSLGNVAVESSRAQILDLSKRGSPSSTLELIRIVKEDPEPRSRALAVRGLAQRRDAKAIDAFAGALDDPNADVRRWAARALSANGRPTALAVLKAHAAGNANLRWRRFLERLAQAPK